VTTVTGARTVSTTVIVCAYTEARWDQISLGYDETLRQLRRGDEIVLVIDHNPELLMRAQIAFPKARVLANAYESGLSGARNTGVLASICDVLVFLDDDACPAPGWLDAYRETFMRADVAVVGGAVEPDWAGGSAPGWFPTEFGWVVGCDYRGLPAEGHAIRNPIGASVIGRIGTLPTGCEETDLCIRIRQVKPELQFLRNTAARVSHAVPAPRQRIGYFLSRCFHEGRSKAMLSTRVGAAASLSSERSYVTRTLPSGVLMGLARAATGRVSGILRAGTIVLGLGATAGGYLAARRTLKPVPMDEAWRPLTVAEMHLESADLAARPGQQRLRLLVVSDGSPLGFIDVDEDEPLPSRQAVHDRLAATSAADVDAPGMSSQVEYIPDVTIVIPTRGRSDELVRCVKSVLEIDYPNFEVIVVDNNDVAGGIDELLASVVSDERLRILHEPRRGVSPARNRGIDEARGEIIAATDDDVVVSRHWLRELVRPLQDDTIDCVTGLVVAAGFQTPAQEMFEEFGGFSKGFAATRFDLDKNRGSHALYPFSPGAYGSGNNLAYRKSAIVSIGCYDTRLGPGTPVRSGEDLDIFLKMLFSGRTIFYQPRAWVRHHHRDSFEELDRQVRDYGRGLSAVILKWGFSDRRRTFDVLRRVPAGLRHYFDPRSVKNEARSASYPASLRRSELRGMLEGLVLMSYQMVVRRGGARPEPIDDIALAGLISPSPMRTEG